MKIFNLYYSNPLAVDKNVLRELYDTLEKLRYPEVAQTSFEKFEEVILTGAKRIDLLYWILQEGPGFNITSFNKLKDNALEDKLLTCYSQIGLCNDENVLLGKCPIDKQLKFLSLLTSLIKNVHLVTNESLKNDKQIINDSLKASPLVSINSNLPKMDFSNDNKNEMNISTKTENSESSNNLQLEQTNKKYNLDELCLAVQANMKELELEKKTDSFETTLKKFNTSFKEVTPPVEDTKTDNFSELYSDLPTYVNNIHSTFLIVNKTLINGTEIGNLEIPEYSNKVVRPLTKSITNNLVLTEQATNMIDDNQSY